MDYFTTNRKFYRESLIANTCLNGKICVERNGQIKNCPSIAKSYGAINSVKVKDIIADQSFVKLWFITKDQIDICRDCEFKNICSDCRGYLA